MNIILNRPYLFIIFIFQPISGLFFVHAAMTIFLILEILQNMTPILQPGIEAAAVMKSVEVQRGGGGKGWGMPPDGFQQFLKTLQHMSSCVGDISAWRVGGNQSRSCSCANGLRKNYLSSTAPYWLSEQ